MSAYRCVGADELSPEDQEFAPEMQPNSRIALELDEQFILRHHFRLGMVRHGDTLTVAHRITVAGRA
jgi:hypothetical protein